MKNKALIEPNYRKKVLISAYSCDPERGSEPGVGWNWVQAIAKNADAWVITRETQKIPIQNALNKESWNHLHFEYVDLPKWLSFLDKGELGVRLYYYLWQFAALARARKLLRSHAFDLAHHVTFVNGWAWTFLAMLPIPFIWGPIGSHPCMPRQLLETRQSSLLDAGKGSIQSIIRLVDPLYWLSVRRAAKIICISDAVARWLPLRISAKDKIIIEPAIAVEELPIVAPDNQDMDKKREVLRVLFVGRFVARKGPDMALEAFAEFALKTPAAHLTMVGDGPLLKRLRKRATALRISDKVDFVPWLPRKEVLRMFRAHDIFLFPSMEGGGMVVLEAMASGIPIVCIDFGGPGQMVTSEVGIKVRVDSRSNVIHELAEALILISQDITWCGETRHDRIIKTARSHFSWEAKARLISELYNGIT
jgi:glycosyltransferase involved in cell wall biosynthesis